MKNNTYIVAVDDLYRVVAESEREAERIVKEELNGMSGDFLVEQTIVEEQEE